MTVFVIGGGAAGMMAAAKAAQHGRSVYILEHNKYLGKKLRITGKGRCNMTNIGEVIPNVVSNGRFLYSALNRFSNKDTITFFESLGVATKVERGGRVFPQSDKAADVVDAFSRHLKELGVKTICKDVSDVIVRDGHAVGIRIKDGKAYKADAVIIATGGLSYPQTGSTGDGYKMARKLGHTIIEPRPSLVPLVSDNGFCIQMQGLSVRNVVLRLEEDGKRVYSDMGEALFTHFGISGPLVLSASCHIKNPANAVVYIDLKPALSEAELMARLERDFKEFAKKDFINSLDLLLPKKMIEPVASLSGIDAHKKTADISKAEKERLCNILKNFKINITGFAPVEQAIVTRGGVCVREIDPKTMESKIVRGVYFAGEVIDVDAYTGGYNLQIAFSTGAAAGESV